MAKHFKPWLSFADQINLLESRGMIFVDKQQAEYDLARIGYYRLSGYFYPFRQHLAGGERSDCFVAGTRFDDVIKLYQFDNAIKLLALEAIQYIEIAMRTQIAYTLGHHNPIAHTDSQYFTPKFNHADWLQKYEKLRDTAKDDFVQHNLQKYGELPIWVACEIWDFGAMSKLYQGLHHTDKQSIEKHFDLINKWNKEVLSSHLKALNFVRNVAAHHGRLWNRAIVGTPSIQYLAGVQWQSLDNKKPFVVFCLMKQMLDKIAPIQAEDWGKRFQAALNLFPKQNSHIQDVNLTNFGIGTFQKTGLPIDLNRWHLWQSK